MYEMNINAGVTGVEQLDRLGTATDRQTERTKRVDEAIRSYTASNDKLAIKLLEIEKNEVRLEQLREQHRMQTERLAAATDKHSGSQERLNSAMKHHVTDVQAASGAIRSFEGHLPIRAVEQFTTKMLGMGGAFQALFPLVGIIGVGHVLDQMIEKVGGLYNAWNPVLTAQEKSLKILKDSNSEYDQLIKKSEQYRLDAYEREHGKAARLREEATLVSGDASYQDQARINYIRSRMAAQQAIINAPSGIMGTPGMMGGGVIATGPSDTARETARATLRGLNTELENAIAKQEEGYLHARDLRAKATESEDKKANRAENIAIEIRKRAAEAMAAAYFGNSLEGRSAFAQVKLRMEESDAIRKDPAQAASIRGSYTLLRTAAYGANSDAIAKRDMSEGFSLDDVSQSSLAHLIRADLANARHDSPELQDLIRPGGPALPPGYVSPNQQLRDVRDSERRYMNVARTSAQLSGQSQRDQIDSGYGARVRFAEQEYQAQLRIADLKATENEREIARADALDQKHQKLFDAQMERERAILEMVLKQKEEFEKNFVGLIHAIRSGGIGDFITRRLESLGDEILLKIGGKIFEKILGAARPKTISIRDAIGGAAKDSPDVQATTDNTVATDDNTRALRDLTGVLVIGGGGAAGTIGFPNGSGGPGVSGGANSTIMYGVPPSGGGGGGSAMSTIGRLGSYAAAAGIGYKGVTDIFRGGGKNVAGGIGEVSMAAAIVDPEPVSKAILAGVAMAASIVSGLFGDPKAARARNIANTLSFSRFLDPVSINASMTTGGGYADFDRFGGIRGSDLSPFPSIDQPYIDHFHDVTVPGRSQYGRGATSVHVTVQALDARSVIDRHQDIGDAVVRAINHGHTPLQETLRSL